MTFVDLFNYYHLGSRKNSPSDSPETNTHAKKEESLETKNEDELTGTQCQSD